MEEALEIPVERGIYFSLSEGKKYEQKYTLSCSTPFPAGGPF